MKKRLLDFKIMVRKKRHTVCINVSKQDVGMIESGLRHYFQPYWCQKSCQLKKKQKNLTSAE